MTFSVYTKLPIEEAYSVDPALPYDHGEERMKPLGLWVSDDNAEMNWPDWCVAENFGLDRFRYRTEVRIRECAKILFIRSVEELDAFNAKYSYDLLAGLGHRRSGAEPRMDYIRWSLVAKEYDGIIITPYLWERRMDGGLWYYGWDCASGCIWNVDAIQLMRSEPFNIDEYAKSKDRDAA